MTLLSNSLLNMTAAQEARVDLAACFHAAARLGLQEGICNHFSAMLPGSDSLFLVNPYGWAFQEITASRLLVYDFEGNVLAGEGRPEMTAFHIHARIHLRQPRARVAFHTHMPNATAFTKLEGPPLAWAGQTALKFYGRTVVDDAYNGLARDTAEGDRIAASMGSADIVFMRNHGVMVVGASIPAVWDDYTTWSGPARCSASRSRPDAHSARVTPALAEATARQMQDGGESARLHLESVKRVLDRTAPEYRH